MLYLTGSVHYLNESEALSRASRCEASEIRRDHDGTFSIYELSAKPRWPQQAAWQLRKMTPE